MGPPTCRTHQAKMLGAVELESFARDREREALFGLWLRL